MSLVAEAISRLVTPADNGNEQPPNYNVPFSLTGVPVTGAGAFIGREADLELLKTCLAPDTGTMRRQFCVIHGLGGLGKTQVAIEFARLNKHAYSSVFWLDGTTEESLIQSILRMETRIPRKDSRVNGERAATFSESKAKAIELLQWFLLSENDKWLLIYDNVDRTSFNAPENSTESLSAYDISEYFPSGDVGSIIITTRLRRLAVLGKSLQLRKLGKEESLAILEKHSSKSFSALMDGSHVEGNALLEGNIPPGSLQSPNVH
jgi:hypothetical protein